MTSIAQAFRARTSRSSPSTRSSSPSTATTGLAAQRAGRFRPEDIQGPDPPIMRAGHRRAAHAARPDPRADRRTPAARRRRRGDRGRGRARQRPAARRSAAAGVVGRGRREGAAVAERPRRGRAHRRACAGRCDSIQGKLNEFDKKVDGQVDVRPRTVPQAPTAPRSWTSSRRPAATLGTIVDDSKGIGGGLAQAMFAKVADKFYDLVGPLDVGIIDVAVGPPATRRPRHGQQADQPEKFRR